MTCCGKQAQQDRPTPTLTKAASAARAILTARRVSPEVINQRLAICAECEHARQNSVGYRWCVLCGCIVDGKKGLTNLASYEEGDGVKMTHGCHHPDRDKGKGWPLPAISSPAAAPEAASGNVGGSAATPAAVSAEPNVLAAQPLADSTPKAEPLAKQE